MEPLFEKVISSPDSSYRLLVREEPTYPMDWHYHPEYELVAIIDSQGRRFMGDHIEDYGPGDLMLVGPGLPHSWQSIGSPKHGDNHRAVVVQFQHDFMGEGFLDRPELQGIKRLFDDSRRAVRFHGKTQSEALESINTLAQLDGLPRLLELLGILEMLAESKEKEMLSSQSYVTPANDAHSERINVVFQYIHENYMDPITQEQVASLIHITRSGFSRFFSRTTGRGFAEYLNDVRTSNACRMLVESDSPVTDICFDVGFRNISNFNRQFRRKKNMSPREFRRMHTG